MITPTEVQKIVDQINANFADDRRRLKELEEQFQTITKAVKDIEEIVKKSPPSTSTTKRATKEATQ